MHFMSRGAFGKLLLTNTLLAATHTSSSPTNMAFFRKFKLPQLASKGKFGNYIDAKILRFDCNKLPVKERIGKGAYGDVYTTEYRLPGDTTTTTVVVNS